MARWAPGRARDTIASDLGGVSAGRRGRGEGPRQRRREHRRDARGDEEHPPASDANPLTVELGRGVAAPRATRSAAASSTANHAMRSERPDSMRRLAQRASIPCRVASAGARTACRRALEQPMEGSPRRRGKGRGSAQVPWRIVRSGIFRCVVSPTAQRSPPTGKRCGPAVLSARDATPGAIGLFAEPHSRVAVEQFRITGKPVQGGLTYLATEALLVAGEKPADWQRRDESDFRYGVGFASQHPHVRVNGTLWAIALHCGVHVARSCTVEIRIDGRCVAVVDLHSTKSVPLQPVWTSERFADVGHAVVLQGMSGTFRGLPDREPLLRLQPVWWIVFGRAPACSQCGE